MIFGPVAVFVARCECCDQPADDVTFYEDADGWDGVQLCDACAEMLRTTT